jgi:hypothetical protein
MVSARTPFTVRIAALIGVIADRSSGSSGCIATNGVGFMHRSDAICDPD